MMASLRFASLHLLGWRHQVLVLLCLVGIAASGQNALYVVGDNSGMQLAFPYIPSTSEPLASKATGTLALGNNFTIARQSDGTVKAWGNNDRGQLGDGTGIRRLMPVTVTGLSNVVAIEAGDSFSLALLSNGTVKAWGRNDVAQLGDGTTTNRLMPVTVLGLT
jgi:alpha-tubulin suppressor-like RCC1 family protein